MSAPRVGIDITANDKTARGIASAEKRFSGATKRIGKATDGNLGGGGLRGIGGWSRGVIRSFTQVEQVGSRLLGGGPLGSGGGSIIGRLGAMRSAASLLGGGMGEVAAGGAAMEAGLIGVGGAAMATGAIIVGLAAGMAKLADSWAKGSTELGNMAKLAGVSTKGLQEFAGAAERVGVDKNTAMGAIGGLSKTLNDARYGRNTGALAVLTKMGVKLRTKEDGTADTMAMLPDIAAAISRQNSSGQQTAANALGISLAALPAFTQGSKALTADMADYGKNGAVVSDDDVKLSRGIVHRDAVATQYVEKGVLAANRANATVVKGAGDAIITGYEAITKPRPAPASEPRQPEASGTTTRRIGRARNGKMVSLTSHDVEDIMKTTQTEWDGRDTQQGRGIIDTILNRIAAGRWGKNAHSVVNSRSQFSDINGPVAWKKGRHSVDQIPMSRVTARTNRLVSEWLRRRADGAPSSVGDNLNYANPYYSDRKNRPWIDALPMVRGSGHSVHRHGTVRELQNSRPGDFGVSIPVDVRVTVDDKRSGATVTTRTGRGGSPSISHAYSADKR
ncbi:hypothetical protein [Sphingomonas fuzhouensis]|uniref:hypothetical protein n=1 Tax=Sphingomonas fuzhouensis TaxID=3106033 RepID=UPI002AFF366A|nr:hypothetical protein [Sphingomonas sp. SGZ-02]